MKKNPKSEKKTKHLFCKYCTYPLESATPLKERVSTLDLVGLGKRVYYAILDGNFKSIELCNFCYSLMQAYRQSLSREDRGYYETKT